MNQKLKELALQIGGSHYPDVQKTYMEPTVRLIIDECAKAIGEEHKSTLLKHFDLQ
jgi:hypothetical protein